MRRIGQISNGTESIGPGTLYGVLKGLVKKGWIIEEEGDESRRRTYVLTPRGRDGLEKEIERLGRQAGLGARTLNGT